MKLKEAGNYYIIYAVCDCIWSMSASYSSMYANNLDQIFPIQYISAVRLCQLSHQNCLSSLCGCRVHHGFIVLYMAPQTEICM